MGGVLFVMSVSLWDGGEGGRERINRTLYIHKSGYVRPFVKIVGSVWEGGEYFAKIAQG